MSRNPFRLFAALLPTAMVLAACESASESPTGSQEPGASEAPTGQEVTVIGTWTDAEQESFLAMVAPWEEETGNTVRYQGTRAINDILAAGIPTGVLPDLAGLPGPGQMAEYAAAGALKPLDDVLDIETYESETSPALVELGKVDAATYGIFIKAAVKGLIWYNPTLHEYSDDPPATWDDLLAQGEANQGNAEALWCLGIESGDASGWPATDWIENILLRQAGPEVYNQWWAGEIPWTDPAIQTAFETYMDVVDTAYGGGTNAVATKFDLAGDPLFADPPGCALFHQASFITGLGAFVDQTAGTDLQRVPVPGVQRRVRDGRGGCRRPVRHVPRHRSGQVADAVPRHRRGPGHLGATWRSPVPEQQRDLVPGRHQRPHGRDADWSGCPGLRRVGPDDHGHECGLLAAHGQPDGRTRDDRTGTLGPRRGQGG